MIRTLLYNKTSKEITSGGRELVSIWQQNADTCIWLDAMGESEAAEKQFLQDCFELHPMAIDDAQRTRHPPKLESFAKSTFILLKPLSADAENLHFSTFQLAIFLGERFLVTRRSAESVSTDALFLQAANDIELCDRGPDALALRLCRMSVDRYLRILLDLEPRLDVLEDEIMQHPDDSMLTELVNYKSELKKFRRVFLYHQQIFDALKSGSFPGVNAEREHEIMDVFEQQERAGSLASLYYELASDLADGYISITSHRLNQIMKILTVIMAIFVPLSFLAGIYGMNFENMPELHSESGYFILLGLMSGIVTILLIVFRKKKWL